VLAVVCPVADDSDLAGVGIFDATPEETTRIMEGDPAVQAGVLSFEVHPVHGFPVTVFQTRLTGDDLPASDRAGCYGRVGVQGSGGAGAAAGSGGAGQVPACFSRAAS
jgi:hypothetical protein